MKKREIRVLIIVLFIVLAVIVLLSSLYFTSEEGYYREEGVLNNFGRFFSFKWLIDFQIYEQGIGDDCGQPDYGYCSYGLKCIDKDENGTEIDSD